MVFSSPFLLHWEFHCLEKFWYFCSAVVLAFEVSHVGQPSFLLLNHTVDADVTSRAFCAVLSSFVTCLSNHWCSLGIMLVNQRLLERNFTVFSSFVQLVPSSVLVSHLFLNFFTLGHDVLLFKIVKPTSSCQTGFVCDFLSLHVWKQSSWKNMIQTLESSRCRQGWQN